MSALSTNGNTLGIFTEHFWWDYAGISYAIPKAFTRRPDQGEYVTDAAQDAFGPESYAPGSAHYISPPVLV